MKDTNKISLRPIYQIKIMKTVRKLILIIGLLLSKLINKLLLKISLKTIHLKDKNLKPRKINNRLKKFTLIKMDLMKLLYFRFWIKKMLKNYKFKSWMKIILINYYLIQIRHLKTIKIFRVRMNLK